jgi:hypothetical protein
MDITFRGRTRVVRIDSGGSSAHRVVIYITEEHRLEVFKSLEQASAPTGE